MKQLLFHIRKVYFKSKFYYYLINIIISFLAGIIIGSIFSLENAETLKVILVIILIDLLFDMLFHRFKNGRSAYLNNKSGET